VNLSPATEVPHRNDPDIAAWLIHRCRRELAKPGIDPDVRRFWQKNLDFNLACLDSQKEN
jgi:hypothetical protein